MRGVGRMLEAGPSHEQPAELEQLVLSWAQPACSDGDGHGEAATRSSASAKAVRPVAPP